jgi:hypothetical protein
MVLLNDLPATGSYPDGSTCVVLHLVRIFRGISRLRGVDKIECINNEATDRDSCYILTLLCI